MTRRRLEHALFTAALLAGLGLRGDYLFGLDRRAVSAVALVALAFVLVSTPKLAFASAKKSVGLWLFPAFAIGRCLVGEASGAALYSATPLWLAYVLAVYSASRYSLQSYLRLLFWVLVGTTFTCILLSGTSHQTDKLGRWHGVFMHRNTLGLASALGLCLALLYLRLEKTKRFLHLAAATMFLFALGKSDSRTAQLATIAVVLVMVTDGLRSHVGLRQRRAAYCTLTLLALLAVCRIGAVLSFLHRSETLTGRVVIWEKILAVIPSHLWLGYGIGSFHSPTGYPLFSGILGQWLPPSAHNAFFEALFETGVIGTALFAVTWVIVGRRAAQSFTDGDGQEEGLARLWPAMIFAFFSVESLSESLAMHGLAFYWGAFLTVALRPRPSHRLGARLPEVTPPHILILVENLPVPFDRRVWLEATALVEAGFAVTIISPMAKDFSAATETLSGIDILRHPLPPERSSSGGYLREYAAALAGELRLAVSLWHRRPFQAIHLCNPPDLLFLVALPFRWLCGVKVIFDQHDLCPELYEAKFQRRRLFYWLLRGAERLTYGACDRVIATNASVRAVALSRGKKKPQDVAIVRSIPDLATFQRPPRPKRDDHQVVVGYLGIMGEMDGLDVLVAVIDELVNHRRHTEVLFHLIGDGPVFHRIQAELHARQLAPYTVLHGRLHGSALKTALSAFDVAVCPDPSTPYSESCTMNKVLEAMAFAIPLALFDLRENRVSAGDAAVYAPSGDVSRLADNIERLAKDAALRASLGAKGYKRIAVQVTAEMQKKTLIDLYQELLGEGTVQPGEQPGPFSRTESSTPSSLP